MINPYPLITLKHPPDLDLTLKGQHWIEFLSILKGVSLLHSLHFERRDDIALLYILKRVTLLHSFTFSNTFNSSAVPEPCSEARVPAMDSPGYPGHFEPFN
jgi:hypothetical protein